MDTNVATANVPLCQRQGKLIFLSCMVYGSTLFLGQKKADLTNNRLKGINMLPALFSLGKVKAQSYGNGYDYIHICLCYIFKEKTFSTCG